MTIRRGPVRRISPAVLDLLVEVGIARHAGDIDEKGNPVSQATAFQLHLHSLGEHTDYLHALQALATTTALEVPHPTEVNAFPRVSGDTSLPPYVFTFSDHSKFYWESENVEYSVNAYILQPSSAAERLCALINPASKPLTLVTVEEAFAAIVNRDAFTLYPTYVAVFRSHSWAMDFPDGSVLACNTVRGIHTSRGSSMQR